MLALEAVPSVSTETQSSMPKQSSIWQKIKGWKKWISQTSEAVSQCQVPTPRGTSTMLLQRSTRCSKSTSPAITRRSKLLVNLADSWLRKLCLLQCKYTQPNNWMTADTTLLTTAFITDLDARFSKILNSSRDNLCCQEISTLKES